MHNSIPKQFKPVYKPNIVSQTHPFTPKIKHGFHGKKDSRDENLNFGAL